jgi:hypothetical protein
MIDQSIINVIVFHRQMGSNDESSNDIEQGEKILFYYPPETPLYQQVISSFLSSYLTYYYHSSPRSQ